jgi:adenosylcobinamide-phosphate synthase
MTRLSSAEDHSTPRAVMLAAAIGLDLLLGEPPAAVHPVVVTGRAIAALERRAPRRSPAAQLAYGAAMAVVVPGAAGVAAALVERWGGRSALGTAGAIVLLKSSFAVRALLAASESVRAPLARGDLDAARAALRSLVSRDTGGLSAPLIAAAAIESLAENLTDSALAPWLAYAVCGLPGAAVYRALNTMDSMIGYRGRYEYLGKAAARADDLANLVPARLGAALIALAAPVAGGSTRRAVSTTLRDHRRTASPNAGWTMAAIAGALDRRLDKVGAYRLGRGGPPAADDIRRARWIVGAALAVGAGLCALVAGAVPRRQGSR